jgi:3'-phosphoadenosine 5'-phosphosulfate sulfotransferase (PAPS reductase)/FAD synthetase/ferredoxin
MLPVSSHHFTPSYTSFPLKIARNHFYRGELVMEARGGNIYDAPKIITHGAGASPRFMLEPINLDALCAANEELMFLLEYEALEFINTTWRKYGGLKKAREASKINTLLDFEQMRLEFEKREKKPYTIIKEDCDSFDIMPLETAETLGKQTLLSTKTEMFIASFSGGKDSQVLVDLVTRAVPPDAFRVIYSDTGYEIPPSLEIYKQTKDFYKKKYPNLEFHLAKNHQPVLHYWDKIGIPSNHYRWCCGVMKTAPLYRHLKEINGTGKQPHVFCYEGVRAEESTRRAQYDRIGRGVKHNNVINARPIFHWNTLEIFLYLFSRNLPINPAYRNGVTRVGCAVCPFASEWSDHFCNRLYPETTKPFQNRIRDFVRKTGVPDPDIYIRDGNWKSRGSGREIETDFSLNIVSTAPDFKAILHNPQENFLMWLKVLGDTTVREVEGKTLISIKYRKRILEIETTTNKKNNTLTVFVSNTSDNFPFITHLRKVLNKTVSCTHCERCEVECPTGALSVVPTVTVDSQKCIHCFKCLDFDDKGCVVAKSLNTTTGTQMNVKNIDRYNTFGLREHWLAKFLSAPDIFFLNEDHGLNVRKQIPALKHWLQEAGIIELPDAKPTKIGTIFTKKYNLSKNAVWEIIWVNLTSGSEVAKWYMKDIPFDRPLSPDELKARLTEYYINSKFSARTLQNALVAIRNTFKESPLGSSVPVGVTINKTQFIRKSSSTVSLAAIAYSLYRYAERNQRSNLTVGEFYKETQKDGIYRQFGLPRGAFETALRTLTEEKNHVLHADLNMGLDNISLREDIRAEDIPAMLL